MLTMYLFSSRVATIMITDSVTENENEEHNEPDVDGSEEDIREELDQTERNVRIESSTSSPHSIEEQQHQLDIQPFPSLEGQSASSEALEGFGLTEGHSDDESSINTVEQHKQHQVNTHEVTLSENQGASSRTLGGPLPTESNPDGEAILLPTEQQQQVDIQSSRLLEDDGVRSADLEEPTPIPPYSSDELNREEQSQQLLSSSPANRTTSVNQQNITTYEYQQHSTTINHDRDDASDHTLHNAPRSRRVWEEDRQASECRRCNRRFNFLVRRHHCRRCGLVVCDRCSSHRIRLPPEEIVQDPAIDPSHYPLIAVHPQRVCDVCNRLPIKEVLASSSSPRRRATAPVSMSHMKRSPSSQSLMTECPVCGTDLLGMQKEDQEKHLQLCLNTGSPPVRPPRYLVYELSENSPQIDYECPICFEEFKAGEKIARMICLCSYHRHCLSDWLERGKGCPVHYDATISA
ncbi:hypothetical protein BDC45DRAFT_17319 [Circinella umbellata]|nr:hypothetical protein BDC45DRAFT_17319 [Circinella umbellata]